MPFAPAIDAHGAWGTAGVARLANNENPLGPSPLALQALRDSLEEAGRYPDTRHTRLKALLASRLACSISEISVGNGSSELIDLTFRVLAGRGGNIVVPRLSFVAYRTCAALCGLTVTEVPIARDLAVDVDGLLAAVNAETRLVVLANPNNPTGAWLDAQDVRRLADALHGRGVPLMLDYAYWEYASCSEIPAPMAVYHELPNVIVLRTFSKAYGLAALRVGYAVADAPLIARIENARQPFNVSAPALAAACAALDDEAHLARTLALNCTQREWLHARLSAQGLGVYAGPTNFLLVDVRTPARRLHERLLERGVVVRLLDAYGLRTCLRVSVGLPEENQALVSALSALL